MSRNTNAQRANNTSTIVDDQTRLLITYNTHRLGTDNDFAKRWKVQALADKVLRAAGLGTCDGGAMCLNYMEICCYVNNFDKARMFLEASLAATPYSDYIEIVEENDAYLKKLSIQQKKAPRVYITDKEINHALLREAVMQNKLKR